MPPKIDISEEIRRITGEQATQAAAKALEVSNQASAKNLEVAEAAKQKAAEVSALAIAKALDTATLAAQKAADAAAAAAAIATSTQADLTRIKEEMSRLNDGFDKLNDKIDNRYVTKEDFALVKTNVEKNNAKVDVLEKAQYEKKGSSMGSQQMVSWIISGVMFLIAVSAFLIPHLH
jgi:hypothetical protein